ncbi:PREDICTED: inositol 1,4,5-trisphosphate receptor-interacting protein-like 1 [Charadrius vociferus]|uniref:inositol 1,4,5-trisphosphate receptor-interacting protein-like 1 n=1 Tax=Charadrius vociferus TaxID=50402 RepID=UPI000521C569|nr:PREDICTED: inositol 1,4,5-trisphosphate receptor-interacting protein-like 1 [Charadrius vociferus]
MPQSCSYSMSVLPSSRSCKLQLTSTSGRRLSIEMVFGLQQGDSDIFLSSQLTEDIFTPSTTWSESYAVAEVKFFRHIGGQAQHGALHLKCLQLFAGILVGTGFSTSVLKTVAMHLLNTIPLVMDATKFFVLVVQSIIQLPQKVGYELDEATRERVQQHAEHLSREMTRLLRELEQSTSQWQLWAVAAVLVLLFRLRWWLWKSSCEDEEYEEEEEPLHIYRFLDEYTSWPLPNRQRICTLVEELVNDLLCACRILSSNNFMPRVQPAVGVGGVLEGWSAFGEELVYRLLVPLKPPPGHSFHLELGSKGDMLVRDAHVRVELECMCTRERRLGDMLCFLHHPEDELMSSQEISLLQTLCTASYLDVQKTAFWLQDLMTAASVAVPWADTCNLTVLPSTRFCKLKLTSPVKTSLYIELILAVQQVLVLLFELCWWVAQEKDAVSQQAVVETSHSNTECAEVFSEREDSDEYERCRFRSFTKRIHSSAQRLAYRSRVVEETGGSLQECLSNSSFPVLQPAISMGSAFKGWSPCGCDAVYLVQDPATYVKAMSEFDELQERFTELLFYRH